MRLPKKPRPKSRIDACYVSADLKPLAHSYRDPEDFIKKRFQYYAPSHGTAVAIGSTFQNANSNGENHVLDASTIIYTTGEHGQRTGVLMALADGCDKLPDENQNLSTGLVAKSACDYFVKDAIRKDNSVDLTHKVLVVGQKSLKAKRQDKYDSSSTLIGAAIDSDKGSFVNVGDGMLLVIDGTTHQVKQILQPQQEIRSAGRMEVNLSPTNVQELVHKPAFQQYITSADQSLKAGDIVVMTSDGVTDVLPTKQITKTIEVRESTRHTDSLHTFALSDATKKIEHVVNEIDVTFLNEILVRAFENLNRTYPNQQPPAFAVADEFVRVSVCNTTNMKNSKMGLANKLNESMTAFKTVIAEDQQRYENALKIKRQEYINIIERLQNITPIVNNFFRSLFHFNGENIIEYKIDFLNKLSSSLAYRLLPNVDPTDKGKGPEVASSQLTTKEIHQLIIASLKTIILPTSLLVEDIVKMIPTIFLKEINVLVEKLSEKSLSKNHIENAVSSFLCGISSHSNIELCIKDIFQNQVQFLEYMNKWANQEKGFDKGLSELVHKFFKEVIPANQVRVNIENYLPYISYIDLQRDEEKSQILLPKKCTVADFQTWLAEKDSQLNSELNRYIDENKFNRASQFEYLLREFDSNRMKFGDDTSVAVAYVPDPSVEMVRAMIDYPQKREQLWVELRKLNPTNQQCEDIYKKLLNEKYVNVVEQIDVKHEQQTVGQSAEFLLDNIVPSYSVDEILDVKEYLLTKIKLRDAVTQLLTLKDQVNKVDANNKLSQEILMEGLTVLESCALYNQLMPEQFAKLNEHRHSTIDSIFGINITHTWSEKLRAIRSRCLQKLRDEVIALCDERKYSEALALLNKSLEQPLFNMHRSNFKLTGAFGDTTAVKEIRKQIKIVEDEQKASVQLPRVGAGQSH